MQCKLVECSKTVKARGMCSMHYSRLMRHGDCEKVTRIYVKGSLEDRFWSKVQRSEGCWEWLGAQDDHGYGVLGISNGKTMKAYKYSFEIAYGSVPRGKVVDHYPCGNRLCVNPKHLRVITNKQNVENRNVINSNSNSGVRGVSWVPQAQRWVARVKHNYKSHHVGSFPLYELHVADYYVRSKREELFTHSKNF